MITVASTANGVHCRPLPCVRHFLYLNESEGWGIVRSNEPGKAAAGRARELPRSAPIPVSPWVDGQLHECYGGWVDFVITAFTNLSKTFQWLHSPQKKPPALHYITWPQPSSWCHPGLLSTTCPLTDLFSIAPTTPISTWPCCSFCLEHADASCQHGPILLKIVMVAAGLLTLQSAASASSMWWVLYECSGNERMREEICSLQNLLFPLTVWSKAPSVTNQSSLLIACKSLKWLVNGTHTCYTHTRTGTLVHTPTNTCTRKDKANTAGQGVTLPLRVSPQRGKHPC